MELSRRQQAALVAICDTFAPGLDGLPSASEAGVPQRVRRGAGATSAQGRGSGHPPAALGLGARGAAAAALLVAAVGRAGGRSEVVARQLARAQAVGVQGSSEGRAAQLLRAAGPGSGVARLPGRARPRRRRAAVRARARERRAAARLRRVRRRLRRGRWNGRRRPRRGGPRRRRARSGRALRRSAARRSTRCTGSTSKALRPRRRTSPSTCSRAGVSAVGRR